MNGNFKYIGLTRLGIKPESTAPESDALTTSRRIETAMIFYNQTFMIHSFYAGVDIPVIRQLLGLS